MKDYFDNFNKRFEKETGEKINIFRTDNGLEYVNKEMANLTFENGIQHQRSVFYTPQQNGKAERENRTLVEAARTSLIGKRLPKNLWAEAINSVAYVLNRTRKTKVKNKSPYELWHKKKANFRHLKVFGAEVFSHIPKQCRQKLDEKSRLGILVGYDDCVKSYRILIDETKKIEKHRDVVFKNELNLATTCLQDSQEDDEYCIIK